MPTFSPEFERTLHLALALANDQPFPYATLEHLLLALLDDKDAADAILACNGDLEQLRTQLRDYLINELTPENQVLPADSDQSATRSPLKRLFDRGRQFFTGDADAQRKDAEPTAGFQRVVQRAVIHVQSSGQEKVTGANALVALFAERESHAAYFLQEQDITRYDVVNYISHGVVRTELGTVEQITQDIEESASTAPAFVPVEGRLHYEQTPAIDQIGERKAAVEERHSGLKRLCQLRANEQPEFKNLVDQYGAALSKLGRNTGAYGLFLAGLDIETFLKVKAQFEPDRERNPPLDADQLFAAQSLIIAHAGLITLFPDIQGVTTELDRYRQMSESLDALRDRILDPIFRQLSHAADIFDNETLEIASEIQSVDKTAADAGISVTQGVASLKHSWIRGALAAIGQYVLRQGSEIGKAARDGVVKGSVALGMKHPDQLVAAMLNFLAESKAILLSLADTLQSQFGWIISLLSHLGL